MKRSRRIMVAKGYLAWRREGRLWYGFARRFALGEGQASCTLFLPEAWLRSARLTNNPLPRESRNFERAGWRFPPPPDGQPWIFGAHCGTCGRLICPDCGHMKRYLLKRKWLNRGWRPQ